MITKLSILVKSCLYNALSVKHNIWYENMSTANVVQLSNVIFICSVLQSSLIGGLATPSTYFLHLPLSSVVLIDSCSGSPVYIKILSTDVTKFKFEFHDVRILATSGVFDIRRIVWSFSVECKQSKNFPFIAQNGNWCACAQLVLFRSWHFDLLQLTN